MNKEQFLKSLDVALNRVPEFERKDILSDYEEHFRMGLENGEAEQEIAKKLGNPKLIAKEILADYHVTQAKEDKSFSNISRAIFATISLSFLNLVFLLGPVIAIFGVYFSMCVTALVMVVSPIIGLVINMFTGFEHFIFNIFAALAVTSLGVLLSIAMIYIGKFLYNLTIRYIEFNLQIIKGGDK